ncbi:MAG TPA: hypothetical protein VEA16_08410 [Vicinamibacterales bacterium]|nr:hypothetical protein [Vicinamibacterales bacterium]
MRVLIVVLFVLLCASTVGSQTKYILASGPLEAEASQSDCYFNIGYAEKAFVLAPHPNGIACTRLKEWAGGSGTLFFVPD